MKNKIIITFIVTAVMTVGFTSCSKDMKEENENKPSVTSKIEKNETEKKQTKINILDKIEEALQKKLNS